MPNFDYIYEPYGDKAAGDIIMEKVCHGRCVLPGCARNCEKMTGDLYELRLAMVNFGEYTSGGFNLDRLRAELGCDCITGLMCNGSWDPYGCKVTPWGCELLLCVPDDPGDLGNVASQEHIPVIDFTEAKLQVWKNGEEVKDGWTADPDCEVWVIVWAK